jgi:hypothetical protein
VTKRSRYAPAVLVAGLLAATAVAFVVTERLKLTRAPIRAVVVSPKVFAPACDCETDVVSIGFVLRRADVVGLEIVDDEGNAVRELVRDSPRKAGPVAIFWNGRIDSGAPAFEGVYRPRLRLRRDRRTILMPNRIRVDRTPPRVVLVSVDNARISPDGDGRRDRVAIGYKVDEPAQVALFVEGVRRTLKQGVGSAGRIGWDGRINGDAAKPGRYEVTLVATDVAGNVGRATRVAPVDVRYVALRRRFFSVLPGGAVSVLVEADARSFRWKLGARSGMARTGRLRVRAPLQPGRFTLTVSVGTHRARAAVVVRRPPA